MSQGKLKIKRKKKSLFGNSRQMDIADYQSSQVYMKGMSGLQPSKSIDMSTQGVPQTTKFGKRQDGAIMPPLKTRPKRLFDDRSAANDSQITKS